MLGCRAASEYHLKSELHNPERIANRSPTTAHFVSPLAWLNDQGYLNLRMQSGRGH